MEMPFDVLNKRLGKIRDNGDIDFDNTAAAVDIDEELQRKFVFIPYEEIVAVPIENSKDGHGFYAGSGPETIRAGEHDNPNWLYNSAVHALAMWQHLSRLKESKIPEPGVYLLTDPKSGSAHTAIVTEDKRVIVPQNGLGTLKDNTFLIKESETPFVWQRIDCSTGDLLNG